MIVRERHPAERVVRQRRLLALAAMAALLAWSASGARAQGAAAPSVASGSKQPGAEAAKPVIEEIHVGLTPGAAVARGSRWSPVRITLSNAGKNFSGALRVGFDGMSPTTNVAFAELPKDSRKTFEFLVRVPAANLAYNTPFVVELASGSGQLVARASSAIYDQVRVDSGEDKRPFQRFAFDRLYEPEESLALVLGRTDDARDGRFEDPAYFPFKLPVFAFRGMAPKPVYQLGSGERLKQLGIDLGGFGAIDFAEAFDVANAWRAKVGSYQQRAFERRQLARGAFTPRDEAERLMASALSYEQSARSYGAGADLLIAAGMAALEGSPIERELPGGLAGPLRERFLHHVAPTGDLANRTSRYVGRYYHDIQDQDILADAMGRKTSGFRYRGGYIRNGAEVSTGYAAYADSTTFLRGSVDLLPKEPLGYDAIDLLIWDGADPESASPEQRRALTLWLRAGGRMIVCGGAASNPPGGWLDDVSPAAFGELEEYSFPWSGAFKRSASTDESWPWSGFEGARLSIRPLSPGKMADLKSGAQDKILAARGRFGGGLVLATAYSLREVGANVGSATMNRGFFDLHFPADPPSADYHLHGAQALATLEAAKGAGGSPLVSVDGAFFLGLAFFAVSIAGNAWLARRLKKPLLFWAMLAAFSLLATVAAGVHFQAAAKSPVVARHFAVMKADSGASVARGTSFVGFESRFPATLRPELTGVGVAPSYFTASDLESYQEVANLRELMSGGVEPWSLRPRPVLWKGDESKLAPISLGLAECVVVGAQYQKELGGAVELEYLPAADPGAPGSLRVKNGAAVSFKNVALHDDPNIVYPIGDLPAGAERIVPLRSAGLQTVALEPSEPDGAAANAWRSPNRLPSAASLSRAEARFAEGFATTRELDDMRARMPELLDRLAPWRREQDAAASNDISIARALLGIQSENSAILQEFQYRNRRSQITSYAGMSIPLTEDDALLGVRDVFHYPADPPSDDWVLAAEFARPAVAFDSGVKGSTEEGVQILLVRLPKSWAIDTAPLAIRAPEPAAPSTDAATEGRP